MVQEITYRPIGIIHSPYREAAKTPIQPKYAPGVRAQIEIFPEYIEGLKDLDGFSHIYLIYHFHEASSPKLRVVPYLDEVERGIFSTRAPNRPNPIGISIVAVKAIEGNKIEVEGCDILDGTPLLDIKPYVERFDHIPNTKKGWHERISEETAERKGSRKENNP